MSDRVGKIWKYDFTLEDIDSKTSTVSVVYPSGSVIRSVVVTEGQEFSVYVEVPSPTPEHEDFQLLLMAETGKSYDLFGKQFLSTLVFGDGIYVVHVYKCL